MKNPLAPPLITGFPAPPADRFPILEIDRPWLTVSCVWPFTEFSGRIVYEKVDGDKRPYLFEAAVDIDTGRWRAPTVSACDPTNENDFEDRDGVGIAGARRPAKSLVCPKGPERTSTRALCSRPKRCTPRYSRRSDGCSNCSRRPGRWTSFRAAAKSQSLVNALCIPAGSSFEGIRAAAWKPTHDGSILTAIRATGSSTIRGPSRDPRRQAANRWNPSTGAWELNVANLSRL